MRTLDRDILLLTILLTTIVISFVLLGESRPDVYVSVTILNYFIVTSLSYSLRSTTKIKFLDIALLIVFMVIVTYRILAILKII